jgi:flavin-binding protein dodecin
MSSIAKVIEVIAESPKSWDDAVQKALAEASKTVSTTSRRSGSAA